MRIGTDIVMMLANENVTWNNHYLLHWYHITFHTFTSPLHWLYSLHEGVEVLFSDKIPLIYYQTFGADMMMGRCCVLLAKYQAMTKCLHTLLPTYHL